MTSGETTLLSLPEDAILDIVRCLSVTDILNVSRTCRYLHHICEKRYVWKKLAKRLVLVGHSSDMCHPTSRLQDDNRSIASWKARCSLAHNWLKGRIDVSIPVHNNCREMSIVHLEDRQLWLSSKKLVSCYKQRADGRLRSLVCWAQPGRHEIDKFVCRGDVIAVCAGHGHLSVIDSVTCQLLSYKEDCHDSLTHSLDLHDDVIISGSRDGELKIWHWQPESSPCYALRHKLTLPDRVWSVAINPDGRGARLGALGRGFRRGAGVLDVQYEGPQGLLSCGHDTVLRYWDLRRPPTHPALSFVEPFDYTLYCVRTDGNNAMVTGTAHFGMTRLWDKRKPEPVKFYFAGRDRSPVYSLAFDPRYLYVSLSSGLHLLRFCEEDT